MEARKDYSRMSLEELVTEEKKTRTERILTAVMMGFMVGVLVYGVATQGFRLFMVALPVLLLYWLYRSALRINERMAAIRSELVKKRAA